MLVVLPGNATKIYIVSFILRMAFPVSVDRKDGNFDLNKHTMSTHFSSPS